MRGRAAVYRRFPFTIILKEGEPSEEPEPLRLKIDPGSKTTGLAVVNDASGQVVWAAELTQRGQQVTARLDQRRACRRSRRSRHTRSRPARFLNRRRRAGWRPHAHLGGAVAPLVSGRRALAGTGEVRYPTHAERRDQGSGVPTGRGGG